MKEEECAYTEALKLRLNDSKWREVCARADIGDECLCDECLDSQMKMIENNQCPCCSKQLTEGCCMECGEVYE